MPDHIHFLLASSTHFSDIMRSFKSYTARRVHQMLGVAGPVWQSRFHDRGIRNERQLEAAVNYIHMNPVKAGIAERAEDFPFSSARAYLGKDVLLGIDTLGGSRLGP